MNAEQVHLDPDRARLDLTERALDTAAALVQRERVALAAADTRPNRLNVARATEHHASLASERARLLARLAADLPVTRPTQGELW